MNALEIARKTAAGLSGNATDRKRTVVRLQRQIDERESDREELPPDAVAIAPETKTDEINFLDWEHVRSLDSAPIPEWITKPPFTPTTKPTKTDTPST